VPLFRLAANLWPTPRWDRLKLLLDPVIASLLRALACIPRMNDNRLLLTRTP
jgi:hypothetical protein